MTLRCFKSASSAIIIRSSSCKIQIKSEHTFLSYIAIHVTPVHQAQFILGTKYSPIKGKLSEVGGIASVTSIKNTVIERRVVIPIATFSPESEGM